MSIGNWLFWLICLGVIAINAALVYVAWWALFADRPRGRRRCPKCWYDMAYSPRNTCPECGFAAREEADFAKTRRRYGVAALAVIISVGVAGYITDRITQRGYASYLPTSVLMWMLPLANDANSGIVNELIARAGMKSFAGSDWTNFIARCAQGDWRTKPVTDGWVKKYGDIITNWRQTFANDEALNALLINIQPRIDLTTREVWPEDVPIVVNVQVRDWWPQGTECRIHAVPRLPNATPTVFGRTSDDNRPRGLYALRMPVIDPAIKEIIIDFQVEQRRPPRVIRESNADTTTAPASELRWQHVASMSLSVPVKIKGQLQQLATAVDSPAMTEAIVQTFAGGAVKWARGSSPVRFNINPSVTTGSDFSDTAVGVIAELLFDGQVARRLNLWWLGGTITASRTGMNYGFEVDFEDEQLLAQLSPDDPRWQMRVRSDPLIALRAGKAGKVWSGEINLPLRVETRDQPAPSRAWWTERE